MSTLSNSNNAMGGQAKKTNYWRRSLFLLGGIFALILLASLIFLAVQMLG